MGLKAWTGGSFDFMDGRKCAKFMVCAKSQSEAVAMVNGTAGWAIFKANALADSWFAVPEEKVPSEVGVWLQMDGAGGLSKIEPPKRPRGRPVEARPKPTATQRVSRSVENLKLRGGHRTTMRLSPEAWSGLQELVNDMQVTQTEVMETLIKEKVKTLQRKKKQPAK